MGAEADNTLADSPQKTNENLRALTHTDIRHFRRHLARQPPKENASPIHSSDDT